MRAIMLFCLIEKDMRNKTTSSRVRRRRSDSNKTRKQLPSSRIHCLSEMSANARELTNTAEHASLSIYTKERNYACAHDVRFNEKEQYGSSIRVVASS